MDSDASGDKQIFSGNDLSGETLPVRIERREGFAFRTGSDKSLGR